MQAKRIPGGLAMAMALPVYLIWHVAKYANTHRGWPAKIATFVTFLPIITIGTAIWASAWTMGVWLTLHLVNEPKFFSN